LDLVLADYDEEMGSSRFVRQGALEEHVREARALTRRPVVSVGRFTPPTPCWGSCGVVCWI